MDHPDDGPRLEQLERRVTDLEGHVKALASALGSLLEAVRRLEGARDEEPPEKG